jgi:hypothetical protein
LVDGETLQVQRFKTPVALVIILLLSVAVAASPVWAAQSDAAAAIASAKNTIVSCYEAAKEAEASGANITALTETLNKAGSLLSQAELAYAINDFDTALNLAVQSQNTLSGFDSEANALGVAALQQRNQDFLVNVVGSIIATFIVVVAGLVIWVFLKRKYAKAGADAIESSTD